MNEFNLRRWLAAAVGCQPADICMEERPHSTVRGEEARYRFPGGATAIVVLGGPVSTRHGRVQVVKVSFRDRDRTLELSAAADVKW